MRGEDEEDGVYLKPGDFCEVGVLPGCFCIRGEGGDDGCGVAVADVECGGCDFDECGLVCGVAVGDEAGGGFLGGDEVAHAAAAGDATGGVDVPVGDEGAGAGGGVHVGAEGHGGGDFSAVECEAFHGSTSYELGRGRMAGAARGKFESLAPLWAGRGLCWCDVVGFGKGVSFRGWGGQRRHRLVCVRSRRCRERGRSSPWRLCC